MFAKRLLRLIVAPSLLASSLPGALANSPLTAVGYGLLAVVVATIWLGADVRQPATSSAPPLTDASNIRPITRQQAIDGVRQFAGQPDLVLEGGLLGDLSGARGIPIFYLESAGPVRGQDFFKVDGRTGEIIEATFRSRVAPLRRGPDLPIAEAERRATAFARERFWGFSRLALIDRSSRASETGLVHSFKWSQIAPSSGAELPVSVSLAVSGISGEIIWYLAQRDPLTIDPNPSIPRERAVEIAQGWLSTRDSRWDTTDPASTRLQVLYDDDDRQRLVWSVNFRAAQGGTRPSIRLLVDGESGQILTTGA
ncbi:MAG: PepSY domain-containing protein [Chloroflexi bacterium]|nr:PepSY domain-containing protein [Chloroflexota bacterium]